MDEEELEQFEEMGGKDIQIRDNRAMIISNKKKYGGKKDD
jgi:hypothetical protein